MNAKDTLRPLLWNQFGATIDMLENAMRACPDDLWGDRSRTPEFWYVASHTLFYLDYYLEESPQGFAPPAPFDLCELDPAGKMPARVYTKAELLTYLEHGREKLRTLLARLDEEGAHAEWRFGSMRGTLVESLIYNLRHVQHHAAQLNLLLRQHVDDAPRWVSATKIPLGDDRPVVPAPDR